MKPVRACLWSNALFVWCSPAGVVQGTASLRCVLETVHDVVGGSFGLWRCFISPPLSQVGKGTRVRVTGRRRTRVASVLRYLLSCSGREENIREVKWDAALRSRTQEGLNGHEAIRALRILGMFRVVRSADVKTG